MEISNKMEIQKGFLFTRSKGNLGHIEISIKFEISTFFLFFQFFHQMEGSEYDLLTTKVAKLEEKAMTLKDLCYRLQTEFMDKVKGLNHFSIEKENMLAKMKHLEEKTEALDVFPLFPFPFLFFLFLITRGFISLL